MHFKWELKSVLLIKDIRSRNTVDQGGILTDVCFALISDQTAVTVPYV